MKFTYLLLCTILLSSLHSIAQDKRKFDPTNARDGENIEYCHQHIKMAELRSNPNFIKANQVSELEFQKKLSFKSIELV